MENQKEEDKWRLSTFGGLLSSFKAGGTDVWVSPEVRNLPPTPAAVQRVSRCETWNPIAQRHAWTVQSSPLPVSAVHDGRYSVRRTWPAWARCHHHHVHALRLDPVRSSGRILQCHSMEPLVVDALPPSPRHRHPASRLPPRSASDPLCVMSLKRTGCLCRASRLLSNHGVSPYAARAFQQFGY